MKHLKLFEQHNNSETCDFSPRRGTLYVVKKNKLSSYYFHEACRVIIDFIEEETINTSSTPLQILKQIIEYVNNSTSSLVRSLQQGQINNRKMTINEKLIIDNIIKLPIQFWFDPTIQYELILYEFLENNFQPNESVPGIILDLDKMIFYQNGRTFDITTKKWTKNMNLKNNYFNSYDFQKKYIENDPTLIFNIPNEMLDDDIKNEYDYLIQSKKYNI